MISISENFLTEIRDNIATNDCYNRMLLNYIIGFYDKFYASTIEKIHESFLQNKPVTEYLDALELLIKYEYQFAVELKGERIVENLSSLIDLIPYLYDRESILNLLITIADKLTDEEYENESYGWIRKLYSFGIPIFDFLDENNFIHIRDLKFIIDIYSDKLLRSIKNKIRAVQYFIGRDIIDEEDELDSEQLLLIKKILTIKRGLIPDNLATEMMVDLTLLTALQRDSLEQNSGCLRLFCATGCIYGKI